MRWRLSSRKRRVGMAGRACLGAFLLFLGAGGRLCAADQQPEEYQSGEFPLWMHKVRRGETILLGSLPFSVFFVSFGYDLYRYASHFNDEQRAAYAPWPFRGANAVPYRSEESVGVMVGAAVTSLLVAVMDFILGELDDRRTKPGASP